MQQEKARRNRWGFFEANFGIIAGLVLGLVAFAPALFHYFTGEDFIFIQAAAEGHAFYEPGQRLFYRPLPNLIWQADYALWGLGATGYHLTNLLLHLLNALLVGRLAQKLSGEQKVSWLATALFALHPIHIEAVDWLASRPDLLATACCLLSLLASLSFFENSVKKGPFWLYLASLLAFAAGLFSKEAAAGLPIALFGILWVQNRGGSWKRLAMWLLPYVVVGGIYGLARYNALGGLGGYNSEGRDLLYITWNLTGGLWLPLLFPLNLESSGPMVGGLLLALLSAFYAGLIWHFFTTKLGPKKSWLSTLLLIYGSLLPALNSAPVDTNLAQSRILYLPSVGFCLLMALFLAQGLKVKMLSAKVLLTGLLLWQIAALQVNLAPWQAAGEMVRTTFSLLANQPFADGDTLYFEGLPDNYQGAYGWRNGLEAAANLLTGDKVGGFNRTPNLKVDYQLTTKGQLWFLRYLYEAKPAGLELVAKYQTGSPTALTSNSPLASWDFTTCGKETWEWMPGRGQIECLPGKGFQFITQGQKTGLTGQGSFEVPTGVAPYYLDLWAYLDYDFEQPQVLAEVHLLDTANGQELDGYQFDLAADGRTHAYRLYLNPNRPAKSLTLTLRANKLRSNILWQRLNFSPQFG